MLALTEAVPRSETRLRLTFTEALSLAAFDASRYAVRSSDATGADAPVRQAMLVAGAPQCVELVLGHALVGGGRYLVACDGVPSVGGGSFSGELAFTVARPSSTARPAERASEAAIERELFGEDLAFEGGDFVRGPNGDLATVSGAETAVTAVVQRMLSEGLAWDATYGAKPREFVDGARGELPALRGRLLREAQQDDRVRRCEVSIRPADANAPDEAELDVKIGLVGGLSRTARVPMQVT